MFKINYFTKYDIETGTFEQKKEAVTLLTYLQTRKLPLKALEDSRIESDDEQICFYPFKENISTTKLKAINSDEQNKYLAVANDKGRVNVFMIEKLYFEKDDLLHVYFDNNHDYVN